MKTPEEVRAEFRAKGVTVTSWASQNGFKTGAVHQVLSGKFKCWYGNAHKIAVLLGIKDGEIPKV